MRKPECFPINVLNIDIEGGWGGSSRSLYFLIKYLDGGRYKPVVLLGKDGPIKHYYEALGIRHFIFSPIPRVTAMKTGNLKSALLFMLRLAYFPKLLWLIQRVIKKSNITIIHLNHESLFLLGLCCKLFYRVKIVSHVRTMLPKNIWARVQILLACISSDFLIFITENERQLWHSLMKRAATVPQAVIYNSAESGHEHSQAENPALCAASDRFRIVSLMTLSYWRGADRLVSIASALKQRSFSRCLFVLCGKFDSAAYEDSLRNQIETAKVQDYFLFLGHQFDPEAILSQCDALIRPSREYNPWGRDVIEALAMGKPVIAIGSYDKFVENGVNGFLLPELDAEEIAQKIIHLSTHPEMVERMKEVNMEKARRLFDGPTNAAKIEAIYEELARN